MRLAPVVFLATLAAFFLGLGLAEGRAEAASVTVVVRGSKTSGAKDLSAAVISALEANGMKVVSDRVLSKSSKDVDEDIAREAGSQLLATITVKKVKKRFVVDAKLIEVRSGKALKSAKKKYKKATSATAIGSAIGKELAGRAGGPAPGEDDEEESPASDRRPVAKAEEDEGEEPGSGGEREAEEDTPAKASPSASKKLATAVVPKDEDGEGDSDGDGGKAVVERPSDPSLTGGEDKLFRFSLAGGSQLASAYTVSVEAKPTQLAYKLNPLILVEGGLTLNIPGLGLGADLAIAFVPVKYQVDVDPAVDPNTPSGRFLDFGGLAFYRLVLSRFGEASHFWVSPLVGFEYASLTVQKQTPSSIVLSWAMTMPVLGARAGLVLNRLALEADGRVRLVLSYGEAPDTTGQGGKGTGFVFSGTARYWTTQRFGVFGRASYLFSKIGFSGAGTRQKFQTDVALQDASIANSELRIAVGVLLAI